MCFDSAVSPLQRFYQDDPNFLYVTGDAASSCIVSKAPDAMQYKILPSIINIVDIENLENPSLGRELRIISELFEKIYQATNIKKSEISKFICNNYSTQVNKIYSQLAGLSVEQSLINATSIYAHCFASDNLINLKFLEKEEKIKKEDYLLTFSTGPYQWGTAILEVL